MWWKDFILRLRALFFRRRMDEELQEELQFHIDMQARKNQRNESKRVEAERQARLQFGSVVSAMEECREVRGISSIEIALSDLRFALRVLRKAPGFAAVAIVTLAIGIGASTAAFSAINALLLRPWPYIQEQERVIFVSEYFPKLAPAANGVAYPDYFDFKRDATETIEGLGISNTATMVVSDGNQPERYFGAFVSADAFAILGVQPILGRNFRA